MSVCKAQRRIHEEVSDNTGHLNRMLMVAGLTVAAVSLRNAEEGANGRRRNEARVRRLLLCLLAVQVVVVALGYWRVLACMLVLLVGSYAVLRFRKSRALERIRLNVHEGSVEHVDVDHEPMCGCVCMCFSALCMCVRAHTHDTMLSVSISSLSDNICICLHRTCAYPLYAQGTAELLQRSTASASQAAAVARQAAMTASAAAQDVDLRSSSVRQCMLSGLHMSIYACTYACVGSCLMVWQYIELRVHSAQHSWRSFWYRTPFVSRRRRPRRDVAQCNSWRLCL